MSEITATVTFERNTQNTIAALTDAAQQVEDAGTQVCKLEVIRGGRIKATVLATPHPLTDRTIFDYPSAERYIQAALTTIADAVVEWGVIEDRCTFDAEPSPEYA